MSDVDDRWTSPGPDGKPTRNDRWGKGKRWQARWREDGRQRAASFATRNQAQAHLDAVRRDQAAGRDRTKGALTVGAYADRWLPTAGETVSARVWYETLVRLYIRPRWGRTPVQDVTTAAVREWLAELATTPVTRSAPGGGRVPVVGPDGEPCYLSASRQRAILGALSLILKHAAHDRAIEYDPCEPISKPTRPRSRGVGLSQEQTHQLLAALWESSEPAWRAALVLVYSGLRWGEMVDLDVADWDGRRLRVDSGRSEIGGKFIVGDTKTHRVRTVTLPPFARPLIDEWLRERGARLDEPLCPGPKGGRFRQKTWRAHWKAALAEVGLTGVRPHDLRHTAASLAIAAGVDILQVQAMLGHARASTTLDIYGHLLPGSGDEVAERMDRFAPPKPKPRDHSAQDVRRTRRLKAV